MIPQWVGHKLSKEDLDRIEAAVRQAEQKTSAELVPMIVARSSVIGHLPLTLTLLLIVTILALSWPFAPELMEHNASIWLPVAAVLSFLISLPLSKVASLQRLLTADRDEHAQVWQRAWAEFFALRMNATTRHQGVLLFVSVMERKAVVLCDQGLAGKVAPDRWNEVISRLTGGLRQGEWGRGFEDALSLSAEILASVAPRTPDLKDELGNRLQIKE